MKTTKNGNVKLEKGEIRIGNFFVKREAEHIRLSDLNGVFTHRVLRRIPLGIWLDNMWEMASKGHEGAMSTLKAYIATMWSFFSVVPDDEYIRGVLDLAHSSLERHPDWYGMKKDATEEEDAEAAKEVREMKEFEEKVREAAENGATGEEGDGEGGED